MKLPLNVSGDRFICMLEGLGYEKAASPFDLRSASQSAQGRIAAGPADSGSFMKSQSIESLLRAL